MLNFKYLGHNLLPSMQATDKNFVVIVAILGLVLFALLISNMQVIKSMIFFWVLVVLLYEFPSIICCINVVGFRLRWAFEFALLLYIPGYSLVCLTCYFRVASFLVPPFSFPVT
ncbi:uncharacterized protein DS421_13g425020 [Arachis hypogaea]|nr:uncharacterized protein DS421_13g425020 [Arachis hypogaea]